MRAPPSFNDRTTGVLSGAAPMPVFRLSRSVGSRGSHKAMFRRLVTGGLSKYSIVGVPFHCPAPGLSVPVAHKGRVETGTAPVYVMFGGRSGADHPAGFGSARFGTGTGSEQDRGHALVLRAQGQSPR